MLRGGSRESAFLNRGFFSKRQFTSDITSTIRIFTALKVVFTVKISLCSICSCKTGRIRATGEESSHCKSRGFSSKTLAINKHFRKRNKERTVHSDTVRKNLSKTKNFVRYILLVLYVQICLGDVQIYADMF